MVLGIAVFAEGTVEAREGETGNGLTIAGWNCHPTNIIVSASESSYKLSLQICEGDAVEGD